MPFKVAGGPGTKVPLKKIRITRGKYFNTGRSFKVIDDWSVRANAHRLLEGPWIGTTDFREVAEFIDDDSDEEEEERREEKEAEEETAEDSLKAARPTTSGPNKEETAEDSLKAARPIPNGPNKTPGKAEHFLLTPEKPDDASPGDRAEVLARKLLSLSRAPLEPYSAQGQRMLFARRVLTNVTPTFPSTQCWRHSVEGECKGRHGFCFCYPYYQDWLGTTIRGRYSAYYRSISSRGKLAPALVSFVSE